MDRPAVRLEIRPLLLTDQPLICCQPAVGHAELPLVGLQIGLVMPTQTGERETNRRSALARRHPWGSEETDEDDHPGREPSSPCRPA